MVDAELETFGVVEPVEHVGELFQINYLVGGDSVAGDDFVGWTGHIPVTLWDDLIRALSPGAIFVGQLFGERDEWAGDSEHPSRVFLARDEVDTRLALLETLHFEEEERRHATALGGEKDWHVFHFIVRKP